ncbi:MAG: OmpA family protein [Peptococcaceae bacterium]|nr:OmpA family protein [Peptococcaceae bacterium]
MLRRRSNEQKQSSQERWLVTYADLITLLLIFFVVMYSMSKVDANKFREIAESLSIALGGATAAQIELGTHPSGPSLIDSGSPEGNAQEQGSLADRAEELTIEGIKAKLDEFAAENRIQTKLVSTIEERGLVVSIQDTLLFEPGSAEMTAEARTILKKISSVLAASDNLIRIEGQTCNLPIHTSQFPSNWELSVLRATNVLQIMVQDGGIEAGRLSATGYGEYRPIADNQTEEGRIHNRRVDLVVLRSKYKVVEPGQKPLEFYHDQPSAE